MICPNKSLPEWKKLVEEVGEDLAYAYWDAKTIPFYTDSKQSAEKHKQSLLAMNGANKHGFINNISDRDLKILREAVKIRNTRIPNHYLEVRLAEVKEGKNAYIVVRKKQDPAYNEAMDKLNDKYERETGYPFETAYESDYKLSDQALEEQDSARLNFGEKEDLDTALQKVEILSKALDVEIQLDYEMEDLGQAIGRKGQRPLIKLNPNKLRDDVVVHEFGHLYIDLLGGLGNQRIQAAIKQLRGTQLWETVAEEYDNLSGDQLAKEVLATAIGIEGSKIFKKNAYKVNWWDRFVNWVFDTLERMGIRKNIARQLASELISNRLDAMTGSVSNTTYSRKAYNYTNFQRSYLTAEEIVTNTIESLQIKINRWQSNQTDKAGYKNALTSLTKDLNKFLKDDNIAGIYRILHHLNTQFQFVTETLDEGINSVDEYRTLDSFIAAYDTVEPIQQYIDGKPQELMDGITWMIQQSQPDLAGEEFTAEKERKYQEIKALIDNLVGRKANLLGRIKNEGKKYLAEQFAGLSDYALQERRLQLEKEFNKKHRAKYANTGKGWKQRFENDRDTYISTQIATESAKIEARSLDIWSSLLEGGVDISGAAARFLDSGQVNSRIVQVVHKMFEKAEFIKGQKFARRRGEMYELFQQFKAENGFQTNQEKMYEIFTVQTENGPYLLTEYDPQYVVEKRKHLKAKAEAIKGPGGKLSPAYKQANEDYAEWLKKNTNPPTKDEEGNTIRTPKDKWKSKAYAALSDKNKEILHKLHEFIQEDDSALYGHARLSTTFDQQVFIKFPSVGKSIAQRFFETSFKDAAANTIRDNFKVRVDDTEYGKVDEATNKDETRAHMVFTNEQGVRGYSIPVYYRGKMDKSEQSYDLFSILMANHSMSENYRQKSMLAADMELLSEVLEDKKYFSTKKRSVETSKLSEGKRPAYKAGRESNELAMLRSIIEHRLYGIEEIPRYLMGDISMNKIANLINSWAASTMLMLNDFSAVTNVLQGKLMNFIEGYGGEKISLSDIKEAEKLYWADSANFFDDIGKINPTSKTSRLLEAFEVLDSLHQRNKFVDNTKLKAMTKRGTLFFMSHAGEHYMHATLMYAVLNKYKVKDAEGYYINKEGKRVDKNKAASLGDVVYFDNGQMKFKAENSDLGNPNPILDKEGKLVDHPVAIKLRNKIKGLAADLHGQYDDRLKNMVQREWYGKAAFMLRKWIPRGITSRFRGLGNALDKEFADFDNVDHHNFYYSEDQEQFEEGRYVSAIRFVANMIRDAKGMQIEVMQNWHRMTDHERANVTKTIVEATSVLLAFLAYSILAGLAEGSDDEDEQALIYRGAFYFRRLYGELMFYVNPLEALRIIKSPAASVSFLQNIIEVGMYAIPTTDEDTGQFGLERYKKNPPGFWEKGDLKLMKQLTDVIPIAHQVTKNPKESLEFIEKTTF